MDSGTSTPIAVQPTLRWSSVRDCPRKAVYEATGAPKRERTVKEERQLYRGKTVGQAFVVALAHENQWKVFVASGPDYMLPYPKLRAATEDEADVIAEMKVAWELGTGHPDLYVKQTDTILEVLSSQHASAEMIHSKLLQARGYAGALDAESIALAVVDPATLEEDRIIITVSSPQWDDLTAECEERVAEVIRWRDTGAIPVRVCTKPGDAWGHFCLHAAHCFEGFQPAPLEQLDNPETHEFVARLYHAKQKEREVKQTLGLIETERKGIEQQLADIVEAGKFQVGHFQISRSPRTRESFKLALARKDSRIPAELLDEFSTVSRYDVWTVDRNGSGEVDFGDDTPF